MIYKLEEKYGFPLVIRFYYQQSKLEIGFIEIYKTGKFYTNIFESGISLKTSKKILKIAGRELRKQKIRTYFKMS